MTKDEKPVNLLTKRSGVSEELPLLFALSGFGYFLNRKNAVELETPNVI